MITAFAVIAGFISVISSFVGYHIHKYKVDRDNYLSKLRVGDPCRFYKDGILITARILGIRHADRIVIVKKGGLISFDKLIM